MRCKGTLFCLLLFTACGLPSGGSGVARPQRPPSSFRGSSNPVLILQGASIWPAEVDSLADILIEHKVSYREIDPSELEQMPLGDLDAYSLLIIPGGDAPTITASMSATTHAKLRTAVQERGLNYLGFCAGAWLAVAPAPEPGQDTSYGIGLVDLPLEEQTIFYKQQKHFTITQAVFPDGSRRDMLWYGGPITPDVPGAVVARYPDGKPAISQLHSGNGFVIVSGLHPTANQPILDALGLSDPSAIAPDFAWKLLDSAMRQSPLPAY